MCVGDNPLLRAMPYFIAWIVSLILIGLIYRVPFLQRKKLKVFSYILSIILLALTLAQYFARYECV